MLKLVLPVFAVLLVLLNLYCTQQPKYSQTNTYLNHAPNVKYVGKETCRSCHNNIYQTFINTGMGQSFDVASKQKSAAKFGAHQVVFDKHKQLYYYPFWQGDTMRIMEFRLRGKDTIYKRVERVDYIIGSGQHTNSHLMNVNGFIYQMPLTWYAQKKKWDLPPGFENGKNVQFTRSIGVECMSCHNAMPDFDTTSFNRYNQIAQGIDCERCHGPGEIHVKEKLAGNWVDTSVNIDYTIVNPKKLSRQLQTDLCQRCHLQGNAVLKPGKKFTDFKPGMKLSDYIDIYMPKNKGADEEFIMASHAQRLQMSACFIKSNNAQTLTCITCHNPHVSVKVTGKQIFNASCLSCHVSTKQKFCSVGKVNNTSNCVGCHMPKSGTTDIPHVSVTDHYIRKPVTQKNKIALKEFAGIYCINNTSTTNLSKTKAYLSYVEKFEAQTKWLDSANYFMNKLDEPNFEVKIHYAYLKSDYQTILNLAKLLKPQHQTDAWTCYRIGRAYSLNGNHNLAIVWYKKSVTLTPHLLAFKNALGAAYIKVNKLIEAEVELRTSLTLNPKQVEPNTNLGYLCVLSKNYKQALNYYLLALSLNPDDEQTLINLVALYSLQHNIPEAKKYYYQLIKVNPNQRKNINAPA